MYSRRILKVGQGIEYFQIVVLDLNTLFHHCHGVKESNDLIILANQSIGV